MSEEIVVIGAGGFGRETLDVIEAINEANGTGRWHVVGVVDDSPAPVNLERLRARAYEYLGSVARNLETREPATYAIGIGSSSARARMVADLDGSGWSAATLVHPSASVGSAAVIEAGVVVCGGVQVSTNVRLGRHVHLNPGSIIGHDSQLGDFVSVNPGAIISGEVTVGSGVLIGAGAVVLQGIAIGSGATVGASACVTRTVMPESVVKGVPAR